MNGWINEWMDEWMGGLMNEFVVQMISQEPNQGVDYEYYLPNGRSREGYFWSYGSWTPCSQECGSGETTDHPPVTCHVT